MVSLSTISTDKDESPAKNQHNNISFKPQLCKNEIGFS